MNGERKPMRFAHNEGHTDICYANNGKCMLTCGSDGDVRIWSGGIEDDDPSSHCVGEMALAIAYKSDRFYVSTDNNYVQAYTFPDLKRDGILARSSAPVTHIDISEDGNLLASASCDMEVQVIDIDANNITKFSGHTAPVLGVSLDPRKKFVVSSSCDGSIKIWEIATGEAVKTFPDMVPTCNDFFRATTLNRPAWQKKSGNYLAILKEKEVRLYERDSWNLKYQLADPDIKKPLSIVLFSPCGNYIAASSIIGEIIIWNVSSKKRISYTEHPRKAAICGIAWHPNIHELAFCDKLGELGVLENFIKSEENGVDDEPADTTMTNEDNVEEPPPSGLFDDDDDDENAISLEKIKASTGWVSPSKRNEDRSSIDNDDSESRQSDFGRKNIFSLTEQQAPFQPSSTPSHFQHRYMLWNSIGIVRCFNTEEEKSIDVEFHDTMFHHALHMNNYEEYTMASLSKKVLALASTSSEENPSKIMCVQLNAWDGSKEWSQTMSEDENIQAICAAGNWVAAATDAGFLRFYSHAGTQRQILTLPGPVVSMAGHEQLLFVVCHAGTGLPGCQNLCYLLYEVTPIYVKAVTACQPVPLFQKSTLKWVGFTDEGTPCVFDSTGILRFLSRDLTAWVVGCDTRLQRKSKLDHYFIIGISEKYQNIRCILCKGSFYPMTVPRPTVIEVSLKLPFNEPDSEKSVLEESFWRCIFSLPNLESLSDSSEASELDKTLKQSAIKLFANACRTDADMRAVDVASFMSEKPLEMAVKYASKLGRIYLADKLSNVEAVDWSKLKEHKSSFFHSRFSDVFDDERLESSRPKMNYSQDIFEESQSSTQANRIIEAERETHSTQGSITPGVSGRVNPFKKKDNAEKGPKGLGYFDSVQELPEKKQKAETSQEKPVKPQKQAKEKPDKSNQPKKPTFVQWYASQKESLKLEYPDLTPSDLTKTAMKIFKEEIKKVPDENSFDSQDSQETQLNGSHKKKSDDPNNDPKKPTFVQWFASRKESLSQEHPDLTPSDLTKTAMKIYKEEIKQITDENGSDSQETQLTEPNKRKANESNKDPTAKKQCVAKKLSLFAFNK